MASNELSTRDAQPISLLFSVTFTASVALALACSIYIYAGFSKPQYCYNHIPGGHVKVSLSRYKAGRTLLLRKIAYFPNRNCDFHAALD